MSITINRVYTRSGDNGDTSLVDGSRVPKDHLRCEAFGTIDELNANLGLAKESARIQGNDRICSVIEYIQQELFDIGAELATPVGFSYPNMWNAEERHVKHLEELCDFFNKDLVPLTSFILPGGSILAASLHQARTVCRRAERIVVRLGREEKLNSLILIYINRLSDLLFVLCRFVLNEKGETAPLWIQEKGRKSPLADFT